MSGHSGPDSNSSVSLRRPRSATSSELHHRDVSLHHQQDHRLDPLHLESGRAFAGLTSGESETGPLLTPRRSPRLSYPRPPPGLAKSLLAQLHRHDFHRVSSRAVAKITAALLAVLVCTVGFVLWLRPELIGRQLHMALLSPTCFEMMDLFHGGNANRIQALFNAFHVAEYRKFDYIAVPPLWQSWICKLYDAEAVARFPIPVVPTDIGSGCPDIFFPLSQKKLRNRDRDVCEVWHQSNFYRASWYLQDKIKFHFSYWKYLMPTGHHYRRTASRRIASLRRQHPDKLIVTVHKRWLDRWCSASVNLNRIEQYDVCERFCHLMPKDVLGILDKQAGIPDASQTHIVLSTDGYMRDEQAAFDWEIESEDMPFMAQLWMWTLSDVHIGHPNSTIDQMSCRFRRLLCEQGKECRPCYPDILQDAALTSFDFDL